MIKIIRQYICDLCGSEMMEHRSHESPGLIAHGYAKPVIPLYGRLFGEKHLCYRCFDGIKAAAYEFIESVKETRDVSNRSSVGSDSSQDHDSRGGAGV